jgi:hypothetical protein
MNTSYVFSFLEDCSMFNFKLQIIVLMSNKQNKQLYDLSKLAFTRWNLFPKHLQKIYNL